MLEVEKVMAHMKANLGTWLAEREITKAVGSKASPKGMTRSLMHLVSIDGLITKKEPGRPYFYKYKGDVKSVGECEGCKSLVEARVLVDGHCNQCRMGKSLSPTLSDVDAWRAARDKIFTTVLRLPFGLPTGAYERIVRGNKLCL
ncbi:hypothetical protein [Vibrio alginolyticus]|uniref:hypothetical protein n=1 Tax=Vibrio alginolyticus TaxID=663 RepID=UPI00071FA072|nr:hypothetical protein [Vibrio alginolyticus]ALR94728.1 hypothetical protein AT730_20710 [Vibrio alginolyticus]MBY7706094.1 hypothetical protein [Vibrio alginolyticus]